MSGTLFSPSWYRVAGLKPRLRAHVEIHRHSYRDAIWFILQDHSSGRSHRLTPAAYAFIGLMVNGCKHGASACGRRSPSEFRSSIPILSLSARLFLSARCLADWEP